MFLNSQLDICKAFVLHSCSYLSGAYTALYFYLSKKKKPTNPPQINLNMVEKNEGEIIL